MPLTRESNIPIVVEFGEPLAAQLARSFATVEAGGTTKWLLEDILSILPDDVRERVESQMRAEGSPTWGFFDHACELVSRARGEEPYGFLTRTFADVGVALRIAAAAPQESM